MMTEGEGGREQKRNKMKQKRTHTCRGEGAEGDRAKERGRKEMTCSSSHSNTTTKERIDIQPERGKGWWPKPTRAVSDSSFFLLAFLSVFRLLSLC